MLSALLVVVPYFGAIAGAIPPVLFALTDSPGKALLVLVVYIVVQQLESNVTIPVVMSQRMRLHPAMIAIGVVVVGQLFGFVGLFVAVPILSLIVICVEEFWVKQIDEAEAERRRAEIDLPESLEPSSSRPRRTRAAQTSFVIAITMPDRSRRRRSGPEPRSRSGADSCGAHSMSAWRSAIATACTRVSASSFWIARLVSDLTVSALSPMRRATSSVWRPSASSWRISRSRSDSGASGPTWDISSAGESDGSTNGLPP